jgi:hypothetical protein
MEVLRENQTDNIVDLPLVLLRADIVIDVGQPSRRKTHHGPPYAHEGRLGGVVPQPPRRRRGALTSVF